MEIGHRLDIADPLVATLAISDGERLFVARTDHGLHTAPPSLFMRRGDDGITVVSEPLDTEEESWEAISPNSLLVITAENTIDHESLL